MEGLTETAFLEWTSSYFAGFSFCIYLSEVPLCYYEGLLWMLLFSTSVVSFLIEELIMEAAFLVWCLKLMKGKKINYFYFLVVGTFKKWQMEGWLALTVQSFFLTADF